MTQRWRGGRLVDHRGAVRWRGGRLVDRGGVTQRWRGGRLVDHRGAVRWRGGRLVDHRGGVTQRWRGGRLVDHRGEMRWRGARLVDHRGGVTQRWRGGRLVDHIPLDIVVISDVPTSYLIYCTKQTRKQSLFYRQHPERHVTFPECIHFPGRMACLCSETLKGVL